MITTPSTPRFDGALSHLPAYVSGFGEIASRYDVVLCDVWGVLHNGLVAFPPARDALARFRREGGAVVLVSNAPRPGDVVAAQLREFGVTGDAFDEIVTSGDLTRRLVAERAPRRLLHIGPDRDLPLYEGMDVAFGTIEDADYVVCTGLVDDERETVEDYGPVLRRMRERGLWMLCANPDILVERGSRLIYCAGALAAAYEALGGETFYPGKPHRPVYEEAMAVAARNIGHPPDRERVLAIGDAIRTDITGAAAFGVESLLIARGIHAADLPMGGDGLDEAAASRWLARQSAQPTFVAPILTWD